MRARPVESRPKARPQRGNRIKEARDHQVVADVSGPHEIEAEHH
jgi:hypothetical protein